VLFTTILNLITSLVPLIKDFLGSYFVFKAGQQHAQKDALEQEIKNVSETKQMEIGVRTLSDTELDDILRK